MSNADINLRDLKAWVDFGGAPYTIGIDDLAAKIGYARHHLQRIFKAKYGITMGKYLCRRRLQRGRHLIHNEGQPLAIAGVHAGYECEQSFVRAFKREYGIHPRDATYSTNS